MEVGFQYHAWDCLIPPGHVLAQSTHARIWCESQPRGCNEIIIQPPNCTYLAQSSGYPTGNHVTGISPCSLLQGDAHEEEEAGRQHPVTSVLSSPRGRCSFCAVGNLVGFGSF